MDNNQHDIVGSNCNPWVVVSPDSTRGENDADMITWQPQVTAPMPLEGLYNIYTRAFTEDRDEHPLLGKTALTRQAKKVWVKPEFFQSNPRGIPQEKATEAV